MLILAVDTTTPGGSVALLEGGSLLAEANVDSAATHSARLFRSIDFLLDARGKDIRDVDAFAVAAGPGSFTGIRIGIGAIKALALASGRPVVAVSTLLALATKLAAAGARLVCPILDAKKGEIYAGLFEAREGELVEAIPQGAYDPDAFFARLPAGLVISFGGSGLAAYGAKLLSCVGDQARFPERSPFIAAEIGRIGDGLIRAGKAIDAAALEPLYFRRSQAEETCRT